MKRRLELICRDILNDKINRSMLKAFANTYLTLIKLNK